MRWLKQMEVTDWTEANHLRHARFLQVREDKNPRDVKRENAKKENGKKEKATETDTSAR